MLVRQAWLPLPERKPLLVYYKHYQPVRPKWEFIGRRSKARCEYENYAVFKRLGIPAPERVAIGEERDILGRLLRTFIVTRAVPNAMTLTEFVEKHCPHRRTLEMRKLRFAICRRLAELTRRMHDAGFFHRDLVWRNVLVTWLPPSPPELWWIDCPRGRFTHRTFLRGIRRLRDLASLGKSAVRWCTAGERIHFMRIYLGKDHLDSEAKALILREMEYRKKRWP